jgi:predicted metal-binding protein
MRLLHEVVSGVEKEAIRMGYTDSKAFAGGSCKMIFCDAHLECQRLSQNGECRNPQYARPSMSGFGIHVSDLIKKCGWRVNIDEEDATSDSEKMSWVAGLILIG